MSDDNLDAAIAKIRRRMALESVPTPAPALTDSLEEVRAAAFLAARTRVDEEIELAVAGKRGLIGGAEIRQILISELTRQFAKAVVAEVFKPKP